MLSLPAESRRSIARFTCCGSVVFAHRVRVPHCTSPHGTEQESMLCMVTNRLLVGVPTYWDVTVKYTTDGQLAALARCMGPESPPTKRAVPRPSQYSPLGGSLPAISTNFLSPSILFTSWANSGMSVSSL